MGAQGAGRIEADDTLPLRPVLTLTEEELLVLTNGSLGVMPARLPELEDPGAADLVRSVALRCLMARGLVQPTSSRHQSGVSWEALEPLGLTLQLRELAPTVLCLGRTLGPLAAEVHDGGPESEGTSATRYLHLHDEIAVIEDVTDDGMHSFLTAFPERYQDAVADFIKPPDVIAGHGRVRVLDGAVDELLAALGNPTVLVETSLVTGLGQVVPPTEPVGRMLVMGPGGSFLSHDSVTYLPVDPDGAITDLLREALVDATFVEATQVPGSGAGAGGPT